MSAPVRTGPPVTAQVLVPDTLRHRDTLFAGVLVTNREPVDRDVTVTVRSELLSVGSTAQRRATVKPGQTLEVAFELAATRLGSANVTFAVACEGQETLLERPVTVLASAPADETVLSKLTEPSSVQYLPVQGTPARVVTYTGTSPLVLLAPWLERYGVTGSDGKAPPVRLTAVQLKAALKPSALVAAPAEVLARLLWQLEREKARPATMAPVLAALETRLLRVGTLSRAQVQVVADALAVAESAGNPVPDTTNFALENAQAAAPEPVWAGLRQVFAVTPDSLVDGKLVARLERTGTLPTYFAAVITSSTLAEAGLPVAGGAASAGLEITGSVQGADGQTLAKDELVVGENYVFEVVLSSASDHGPAEIRVFLPSGTEGLSERVLPLEALSAGVHRFAVPFRAIVQGSFPTPGPSVELTEESGQARDLGRLFVIQRP